MVALVTSRKVAAPLGAASLAFLKPTGALAETVPRAGSVLGNTAPLASGTLRLTAIPLPSGLLVSGITFLSGTQALVAGTNQWFVLLDSARLMLGVTADDTSTAWLANTPKPLNLASAFRTTYSGLHYLGLMVAAGTPPSLIGVSSSSVPNGVSPVLAGNSNTGQTTPPVAPFTATAPSASGIACYGWVT